MSTKDKNLLHKNTIVQYKGYQLLESQIRYACENTWNCTEAARWLNIDFNTFKKYASMYVDSESGLTLFELHKRKGYLKEIPKPKHTKPYKGLGNPNWLPATIEDVLAGKTPSFYGSKNATKLKWKLIYEGSLPECCHKCGFNERRFLDGEVPLRIHFKNNNPTPPWTLDDLEFLCHNCYFLYVGNLAGANKSYIETPDGEYIPKNPNNPTTKYRLKQIEKMKRRERKGYWSSTDDSEHNLQDIKKGPHNVTLESDDLNNPE